MFLSLSGTLTSSVNSLASLVPSAVSLTISAGRLMDIVEMPQEDYSHDDQVIAFEKDHRAEGIGIAMQDLSYSYNTGTEVFRCPGRSFRGGQNNDAAADPVAAPVIGRFVSYLCRRQPSDTD